MQKKIITLLFVMFFAISSTACSPPKTMILFNNEPITKETILSNASQFTAGKKIYYLFITEKHLDTNIIRVRVLKKDGKVKMQPIVLVYSNDFRMNKDQLFYYNDYIVINDAGDYCMVIYARDSLDKPLAVADFRVKK